MAQKRRLTPFTPSHYAGDHIYVRPTFCVSIPQYVTSEPKNGLRHRNSLLNLRDNSNKGDVSHKSQSKIKNAVNWLIQASKPKRVFDKKSGKNFFFRVNFVTLTIPEQENMPSDNEVKARVFHPFIIYLRKYCGLRNYVWRAETQENGMIHFHIVTDSFLHWKQLRRHWNRILLRASLLDKFTAEHGHANPNSTDVHSVKGIRNLGAYISKYVSKKKAGRRSIQGRLWGCNYELSHENKTSVGLDPDETADLLRILDKHRVEWKRLESKPDALGKTKSVGTLHIFTEAVWKLVHGTALGDAYASRIFQIRSNVVTMPIDYYVINEDSCQLTTQNTLVTGSTKSDRPPSQKQNGSVSGATLAVTQLVIEIPPEDSWKQTSMLNVGAN